MDIKSDLGWLQRHERLLLIFAGIVVVGFLLNKYENLVHDADIGRNAVAQEQLKQQIEQNKQLAAQFEAMKADYDKREAAWRQQEQTLISAISNRNQATNQQQQNNNNMTLAELARRWALLVSAAPDAIQVAGSNLSVSEQTSHVTVNQLELVPTLQANVKDQEILLGNKDKQIDNLNQLMVSCTNRVDGLNKQIVDADKACKTEIATVKSAARKSKIKWFATGIGAGVALVIKFGLF